MSRPRVPIPNLHTALRRLLDQIPRGRVTTYGDLAEALGSLSAARWVGEYLARHDHDNDCPCHRVVRRTGELGLYVSGEITEKQALLEADRVRVSEQRVDLLRYRHTEFDSRKPLRRLIRIQDELPARTRLRAYRGQPQTIAGVDLSYEKTRPGDEVRACAAYACVDTDSLELIDSHTVRRVVRFPYIPGLLSFREAPVLFELLSAVEKRTELAEVLLVDGNGILHPRRAGIATFVGVHFGLRTIGVSKSLLCGSVESATDDATVPRAIRFEGNHVGFAVGSRPQSRPVFVSPGHRITVGASLRVVQTLFKSHRVPEPIYHADRISRAAVREA